MVSAVVVAVVPAAVVVVVVSRDAHASAYEFNFPFIACSEPTEALAELCKRTAV